MHSYFFKLRNKCIDGHPCLCILDQTKLSSQQCPEKHPWYFSSFSKWQTYINRLDWCWIDFYFLSFVNINVCTVLIILVILSKKQSQAPEISVKTANITSYHCDIIAHFMLIFYTGKLSNVRKIVKKKKFV